uniref:Histone-lysine N-methyltransferase n=1 Tax=Acrobeloides nanus TaxID=290746 RepID=A0A914DX86_9BILA
MINKIIFAGFLFELFLLDTSIKEEVNQREEETLAFTKMLDLAVLLGSDIHQSIKNPKIGDKAERDENIENDIQIIEVKLAAPKKLGQFSEDFGNESPPVKYTRTLATQPILHTQECRFNEINILPGSSKDFPINLSDSESEEEKPTATTISSPSFLSIASSGSRKRRKSESTKSSVSSLEVSAYPENAYEVQKILATMHEGNTKRYYLKWIGWPYTRCTWESQKNLIDCNEVKKQYRERIILRKCVAALVSESNQIHLPKLRESPAFYKSHEWEDELNKIALCGNNGKIYVENWVDSAGKPKDFTFITEIMIDDEVKQKLAQNPPISCNCQTENCGFEANCCPARGRQIPVVLFRTNKSGWSVRTCQKIMANTFVMEYIGEVITFNKAEQRSDQTYQFEMIGNRFVVDGLYFGNEARFVNHSCEPNLRAVNIHIEGLDVGFHRIAFFSVKDIEKGEELTLDYWASITPEEFKKMLKAPGKTKCLCKTKKCRGYLLRTKN